MDRARALPPVSLEPALDRAFALAMLGFWVLITLLQQWGEWAEDLSAVYIAGWLWQHGQGALVYDAPPAFFGGVAASWLPAMETLGVADRTSFAYVYPPLWAALAAPLTAALSPQGFFNAVALVQIPLLAASVPLAGRLMKPATLPWWIWTSVGLVTLSLSMPSHLAVWHNQPTITVSFLLLLAFERLNAGRPGVAGAALALAAAIKLSPAAFVLVFLLDREWRATASFLLVGAGLAALSVGLAGWPAHQAFLQSLAAVKSVAYLIAINVSLLPGLLAVGSVVGAMPDPDPAATQLIYTAVPVWLSPAISALALVIVAVFVRALRPVQRDLRRNLGVFALSILIPLMGPLGWLHYYLVPTLLLPGLIGLLPRGAVLGVMALIGVPSLYFVFSMISALPWPVATYTWFMSAAWLCVLFAIYRAATRAGT